MLDLEPVGPPIEEVEAIIAPFFEPAFLSKLIADKTLQYWKMETGQLKVRVVRAIESEYLDSLLDPTQPRAEFEEHKDGPETLLSLQESMDEKADVEKIQVSQETFHLQLSQEALELPLWKNALEGHTGIPFHRQFAQETFTDGFEFALEPEALAALFSVLQSGPNEFYGIPFNQTSQIAFRAQQPYSTSVPDADPVIDTYLQDYLGTTQHFPEPSSVGGQTIPVFDSDSNPRIQSMLVLSSNPDYEGGYLFVYQGGVRCDVGRVAMSSYMEKNHQTPQTTITDIAFFNLEQGGVNTIADESSLVQHKPYTRAAKALQRLLIATCMKAEPLKQKVQVV